MSHHPISTDKAPKAIGPYSQAIKTDDWLFCSGQIAIDPNTGKLVDGGIIAQTNQVLQNLNAVLDAADFNSKDVMSTTIYLTNLDDFSQVNQIYGQFFHSPFPARATIQVSRLPLNALVEISAIAKKN